MTTSARVESGVVSRSPASVVLPVLVGLFFLSGISGLIYQILWLRLLALVFGVTIYAASTVLASFMAGLALGSFAAGRLADHARSPLLWFGLAETFIGLSALASPVLLDAVQRRYVALASSLPDSLALLTLIRFVFSFAILLLPTTLMGASLPLVVKSSLLRGAGLGERVGLLYGTNTAGAIVGTVLAGFYLIGDIGIDASFRLAATLNVLVGLSAAALALALGRQQPAARARRAEAAARRGQPATLSERDRRLVLVVFALSGFAALALEVVWFRVLVLYLEVTTYAFTTMLATVLAGIALGSYLVTPLMRRRWNWLVILAAIELALGTVVLLSFLGLSRAPRIVELAQGLRASTDGAMIVTSALAVLPATLLMGIAFPIGLHLWASGDARASGHDEPGTGEQTGKRIGLFYSLNVFGAILGALAAGFLLLPLFGSLRSLIAVSLISLLSGLLLLIPMRQRALAAGLGLSGAALFLGAALIVPDPFDAALSFRHPNDQIIWKEEGLQLTVSVHDAFDGTRVLYLDGLHQANDRATMVQVHSEIGLLPIALHPDPRTALVIGLGGGVTPGALSSYRGASVDVVELSRSVVRAAEWFSHVNRDVLAAPNVELHVDDGRNHLLLTDERYDIITADIIRPEHAGAGNLYSAEYFRLAREALDDDGMMVQWVDPGQPDRYRLILRTFTTVFPDATLWVDGRLLVGTKRPLELHRADFERKLHDAGTRAALESVSFGSFDTLLGYYVAGPAELAAFLGPGPILTDDRPMVEYFRSLPDTPFTGPGLARGDVRRHLRE